MKHVTQKFITIWLLAAFYCSAQVQNNGAIYIADNVEMYVATSNYNFGITPASTTTSRTPNYGRISFAGTATSIGASDGHNVDGYVRKYGTSAFLAPVGQSGTYAPVQIASSTSSAIDVAYYRTNPTSIGSSLGSTVSSLSAIEYWNIIGNVSCMVSISWRGNSNINTLTGGNINRLTIIGWNGSSWNEISSVVDTTTILGGMSNLTTGSISSTTPVDLNTYSYFTFGIKAISCQPLVSSSQITKTWNGSWSPSAPTLADPVVINAPYSGNISCNSLVLNADITLANGQLAEIVNDVTGNGKIIMASEATIVQRNETAIAPKIELTKVTNPMRRLDYVYLSSPITDSSAYFSNLTNNNNVAVNGNFGSQSLSPFYDFLTYNSAGTSRVTANATTAPVGIGHSAAVRSMAPYSTSQADGSWYTEKYPISIKVSGSTNNGNVSVPIPANGWVYIGNPYPSAISGEKLLDATGNNMRKTLYFWTFSTPRVAWNNSGSNYTNADYATWNYSGGVAACSGCQIPTGKIASMQSVLMRSIVPSTTTLELTNCMREATGNNNFFRSSASVDDKFRLNLLGQDNSFCQTLIAYSENGTLGYDSGYDATKIISSTSSLTSLTGTTKCAIQTRPPFEDTDVVPLQIDTPTPQTFTISLATKEGIFNSETVTIFLHDTVLGIYHNLNEGAYTFLQTDTSNATRFEVVYLDPSLSNNENLRAEAMAFINQQTFFAQASINISEVEIYDMQGRLIETYKNINQSIISMPFYHAQSVYIAKIKLTNGLIATTKLINQ